MKNKVLILLSVFACLLLITSGVNAKSIVKVDKELNEKGEYDSSRLLIGNNVTSKEDVDGISAIVANNANIKGSANYALYIGNIMTIESSIDNDLFIAGNNVNISSEAKIERDIYAFASDMKINATDIRNVRYVGNSLDIRGITIKGDLYADANEIIMDKNTVVEGKITCFDYTIITGKGEAKIGKIVEKEKSKVERITLLNRLVDSAISALSLFVVLAIVVYLFPKVKTKVEKEQLDTENILKTIAKGLFALIIIPIAAFIALFTTFLAPLSLIVLVLYTIVCYVSSGVGSFIIADKIMSKYAKTTSPYIRLLVGIVVVKLLALIPYVGPFITILFMLYGLGFTYKLLKMKIKA